MKFKLKFSFIALILVTFFLIGAVSANENVTLDESNDILSAESSTYSIDNVQIDSIESDSSNNQESSTIAETKNTTADYQLSSDDVNLNIGSVVYPNSNVKNNFKENILAAPNDNDVLGATRYLSANTFQDFNNIVMQCGSGDTILLNGATINRNDGFNNPLNGGNGITIIGGEGDQMAVFDSKDVTSRRNDFTNSIIKNVIFKNFHNVSLLET